METFPQVWTEEGPPFYKEALVSTPEGLGTMMGGTSTSHSCPGVTAAPSLQQRPCCSSAIAQLPHLT